MIEHHKRILICLVRKYRCYQINMPTSSSIISSRLFQLSLYFPRASKRLYTYFMISSDMRYRYFIPHLHLTLLSASAGSVPTALTLASRAAFSSLRIPKIKRIGWEAISTLSEGIEGDQIGIKGAVNTKRRGKGRGQGGPADEWDLDLDGPGDGTEYMERREDLPVLITLNMVSLSVCGVDLMKGSRIGCGIH